VVPRCLSLWPGWRRGRRGPRARGLCGGTSQPSYGLRSERVPPYLGLLIGKERLRRLLKRAERFGLLFRLDLDKASGLFERYGGEAVLVGQLIPGVGGWISVPAGLERMPIWWRFIGYTIVGSALWDGSLIALGWALGTRWKMVGLYASIIGYVVLCVVVFGMLWFLWRRWKA
jgi:membrane protein DedA with SNARE-associated domain